ncbi:caspase domain-containing protein [Dactylosporangium sp. NPDC000521]|uniref:caspase family protein n=1 Tax=Dactylosporangium sp. NPDC000521 TaxID=3363975 RepID=UPI0036ABD351
MTAVLPDPAGSRAVLVGVSRYRRMDGLGSVRHNLEALRGLLVDAGRWGLPDGNCVVLPEPESTREVLDVLHEQAVQATDTLLFYFAGHGLIDVRDEQELYLALGSADQERPKRDSIPYKWVRDEFLDATRARRKIVILDCCYSGRALGQWMGAEGAVPDGLDIFGTCTLTATARTRMALAPSGQRYTAFTGELIAALQEGIPQGPELLDLDTLFRHVDRRLHARGWPRPQRGALDNGGMVALARNVAHARPAAGQPQSPPAAPPAQEQAQMQAQAPLDGTCPICGAALDAPGRRDPQAGRYDAPPSFLLEVGARDHSGEFAWRVTAPGTSLPPAVSVRPAFVESEVEYTYRLCADGHIFPHTPSSGRHRIDRWNMTAVVGIVAGGKTYLLVRMLNQHLTDTENIFPRADARPLQRFQLSPLEHHSLTRRYEEYTQTLREGRPISPTSAEDNRPARLLQELLPDALDAIREVIRRTVVDGARRAERWGLGRRQPYVIRTGSAGVQTWNGFDNLPGELFAAGGHESDVLRGYDTLIWAIDPAVAADALDPLLKDGADDVLDGSLRPGTTAAVGSALVRSERRRTEHDIGSSLTLAAGGADVLVAITKCDLIHAALRRSSNLEDLGRRGSVRRGVAAYLATAGSRNAQLSDHLLAGRPGYEQRVYQVADGLLAHYSRDDAFWGLIEEGLRDVVDVPGLRIDVDSIGEHLDRSEDEPDALLIRDLVLSAVGCGIAFGLGHETTIMSLLRGGRRVQLFPCSALGTVPAARSAGSGLAEMFRLEPLEPGARFPEAADRSAALTQLLLAALRRARS